MAPKYQIFSTLTCTGCGHQEHFRMPRYAMKYHYECPLCKSMHKTKEGECCIFCSYGDVKCPTSQGKIDDQDENSNLSING